MFWPGLLNGIHAESSQTSLCRPQRQQLSEGGLWWARQAQDYMHPLRSHPNRAESRTPGTGGGAPADCQFFTLSTGVSGAGVPREEEPGHFEGYRAARTAGREGLLERAEREQTRLSAASSKIKFLYGFICFCSFISSE